MTREDAVALVHHLLDAASRRDLDQVMACYADGAIAVSPVFGIVRGRAGIRATWNTLFTTFADLTVAVSDILVDANRVAVLSTITTTDRVGWFGLPATGGPIGYRLVLLLTTEDGAIVRDERIYDSTGVLERLEKARLDKELRTAADVQRALLPHTAHVSSFCESAGDSVPCRAIGGDFFEFIELPTGNVGIAMGDVAGKGPAAALLAAMLQGMIVADAPAGDAPAAVLTRLNRRLATRGWASRFATLVYGVLSPDGRFVYSSAGHNPPALLTRAGICSLNAGGPILGAFEAAEFEQGAVHLQDGDTVVMYTDGVTEARNPGGEEFGDDRLLACLHAEAASPPDTLLRHVFTAVTAFCEHADQGDDITVMVTRFGR